MTLKKIDLMTLMTIFITAILIFFMPYIVETVQRTTDHCSVNNQQSAVCKPVLF